MGRIKKPNNMTRTEAIEFAKDILDACYDGEEPLPCTDLSLCIPSVLREHNLITEKDKRMMEESD